MRLFTFLAVLLVCAVAAAAVLVSESGMSLGSDPQAPMWLFAGLFALGLAVVEGGRRAFIGPR